MTKTISLALLLGLVACRSKDIDPPGDSSAGDTGQNIHPDNDTDSGTDIPDSADSATGKTDTSDSAHGDTADTARVDLDGDGFSVEDGDCDDADATYHPETSTPEFGLDICTAGTLFVSNDDTTAWSVADLMGDTTTVSLDDAVGCQGDALSISYSLAPSTGDGSWFVIRREFESQNLVDQAFLTFPFRGETEDEPDFAVELKLEDSDGCRSTVRLEDATDLPAWRPAVLALAQFSVEEEGTLGGEACTVDLSQVAAVELAVSDAEGGASGTLYIDDLMLRTLDEVRHTPADHFVCPPIGHDSVLEEIATSLATKQSDSQTDHGHALVPSWYEEDPTVYYMYDQGLALSVFSLESARTSEDKWQEAADSLANQMVGLLDDATGIWSDGYVDGDGLEPRNSNVPWCGNIAWSVIGLRMYLLAAPPDDADAVTAIEEAIAVGADWLLAEIADFSTHYPDLKGSITTGTEGGISTYFALQAADTTLPSHGYGDAAEELAAVLLAHNWIAEEERFGMGIDDPHLALDVVGNWGTRFLLHRGMTEEAHTSLALAAGVFPVQSWDESVTAMGDIAGPWQPTVEFSAQYAAVGGPGGATILEQLIPLGDNGSYPGATADFNGGPGWNTSWHGISASSWVYFALSGGLLNRI